MNLNLFKNYLNIGLFYGDIKMCKKVIKEIKIENTGIKIVMYDDIDGIINISYNSALDANFKLEINIGDINE